MAGLVSRHADGSLVADAMQAVGVTAIRGSSRRGGAAALRQMMEAAADYHIAIATDGPQGPRHVVKEGIIYLASQTGRPVVPAAFSARSAWRPRGRWTDMVVPRPFSRTYVIIGSPIAVPAGLSREELEPYRQQVQRAMDAVTDEAERRAGGVECREQRVESGEWRATGTKVSRIRILPASAADSVTPDLQRRCKRPAATLVALPPMSAPPAAP
jgi:hypothetical protein